MRITPHFGEVVKSLDSVPKAFQGRDLLVDHATLYRDGQPVGYVYDTTNHKDLETYREGQNNLGQLMTGFLHMGRNSDKLFKVFNAYKGLYDKIK